MVSFWDRITGQALADIYDAVTALSEKVDQLMSEQAHLDADVQAIQTAVSNLAAATTAIQSEIASLKTANPALDTSGLDAAVASLNSAVSGVQGLAPPAEPAAG